MIPVPRQRLPAEPTLEQLLPKITMPKGNIYALKDESSGLFLINSSAYCKAIETAPGDDLTLSLVQVSQGLRPIVSLLNTPSKVPLRGLKRQHRVKELAMQSSAMLEKGKFKESEQACSKLLSMIESEADLSSQGIASSFTTLSRIYIYEERFDEFEKLMAYITSLVKLHKVKVQTEFALAICDYVGFLTNQQRFAEADDMIELGLLLDGKDIECRFTIAMLLIAKTKLNLDAGQFQKAIEVGLEAETIFREIEDENNDFAVSLQMFIGKAHEEMGEHDKAMQRYLKCQKSIGGEPENSETILIILKSIGSLKAKLGQIDEAFVSFKEAFDRCMQYDDIDLILDISFQYATLLLENDRDNEAMTVASTALRKTGPDPSLLLLQGQCHLAALNLQGVVETLQEAMRIIERTHEPTENGADEREVEPPNPELEGEIAIMLANALENLDNHAEAEEVLAKSLSRTSELEGPHLFELNYTMASLLNNNSSRAEEAEKYAEKARDFAAEYFTNGSIEYAKALDELATARSNQTKYEGVTEMLETSLEIKAKEAEHNASLIETYLLYISFACNINDLAKGKDLILNAIKAIKAEGYDDSRSEVQNLMQLIEQIAAQGLDLVDVDTIMKEADAIKKASPAVGEQPTNQELDSSP